MNIIFIDFYFWMLIEFIDNIEYRQYNEITNIDIRQ